MLKKNLPLFFSLIFILIFFAPVFLNRVIIDGDLGDEYMPKLFLTGESIRNFSFPVSVNGMALGFPVYKDIQSCIYYPLNWIFALPLNFLTLVQTAVILNVLLFMFGIYLLFTNVFGLKKHIMIFLPLLIFNGFIVSHIPHYTMLCSIAVAPYFLLYFIQFLREKKRKLFILSTAFLVLEISAGHPQILFLLLVLSAMIFIKEKKSWRDAPHAFMIIFFGIFIGLFILAPTLSISKYSFRSDSSLAYNLLPLKYLILLIFPNLFGGSNAFSKIPYEGVLNINEVQFYASLFLLFIFSYIIERVFFKKDYKYAYKLIIPAIIFLLGYFTEFNAHIFLTPVRAVGFSILVFIVIFLKDAIEEYNRRTLLVFAFVFVFFTVMTAAKGFGLEKYWLSIVFFAIYFAFLILFLKNKNEKMLYILSLIIFFDLILSLGGIIRYEGRNKVENIRCDEIRGKYVITYLPDDVMFYADYLKKYQKTDNLEELKKFSTLANRGVYYDAFSFNLYQNFTFKKYIEYFSDNSIMNGGFSNIKFILNPLIYKYEYVFIPDMPAFFKVSGTLLIPYCDKEKDSFYAYYKGNIENIEDYPAPDEEYLINEDSLKRGILTLDGQEILKGDGRIIMLKDIKTGDVVHFPYMFEKMNFQLIEKNPFCLFKRNAADDSDSMNFRTSPVDGSFIKGKKSGYLPMDLLGGLFLSIIALITMFTYAKKEFQ